MASLTVTAADALLKQLYPTDVVAELMARESKLLGMINKMEDWSGRNVVLPAAYGSPRAVGATFATAQANKVASKSVNFNLTTAKLYGFADIDNETIEASKSDRGSFVRTLSWEMNRTLKSVARRMASQLYRSTTGNMARVSSGTASPITLTNPEDTTHFEVGDIINAVSDDTGSGTVRSGDGTITAINRTAGTITYSGTITSIAPNDYIHIKGDYNLAMAGLEAWVPASAPGATSFFGVDRSVDTRLGGLRYDGSSDPINEAVLKGCKIGKVEGALFTHAFANPARYMDLMFTQQGQIQYVTETVGRIGFSGMKILFGTTALTVFDDPACPADVVWLVNLPELTLYSRGPAPHIVNEDGLSILRNASSDSYETRVCSYGNLGTPAPNQHCRVAVATS